MDGWRGSGGRQLRIKAKSEHTGTGLFDSPPWQRRVGRGLHATHGATFDTGGAAGASQRQGAHVQRVAQWAADAHTNTSIFK